jgi:hypothetical protein
LGKGFEFGLHLVIYQNQTRILCPVVYGVFQTHLTHVFQHEHVVIKYFIRIKV